MTRLLIALLALQVAAIGSFPTTAAAETPRVISRQAQPHGPHTKASALAPLGSRHRQSYGAPISKPILKHRPVKKPSKEGGGSPGRVASD